MSKLVKSVAAYPCNGTCIQRAISKMKSKNLNLMRRSIYAKFKLVRVKIPRIKIKLVRPYCFLFSVKIKKILNKSKILIKKQSINIKSV